MGKTRPYRHAISRLSNGLEVVTVAMPHLHTASLSLFVKVGSRHEKPETNGLSHFLEHMFFRGCDGFPDSTILNAAIEDLGGYLDGYTTRDYSGYQTTVHPAHVLDATEILGQMFKKPLFDDIEIERSIILEEILDVLDDRGREVDLDTIAHRLAFSDHPLGRSIDGPRKNIKKFGKAHLEKHRRSFYGAKNMVLCFSGNIDPSKCRKAAGKAFGDLFSGRRSNEGKKPELPSRAAPAKFVRSDDAQTRTRLSFRTVPDTHADYPALLILRRVLDGGLSARLQTELVEKRGIVYDVSADLESYSDCGLFDFELAVAHKKLEYALTELLKVIDDLRSIPVKDEELFRIRKRARMSLEMALDSTGEVNHWFGEARLFHEPIAPDLRIKQFESVRPTELRKLARKYLTASRLTIASVGGTDKGSVQKARRVIKSMRNQLR